MNDVPRTPGLFRRWINLLWTGTIGTCIVAAVMIAPTWGLVIYRQVMPRSVERNLIDGSLRTLLASYLVGIPTALLAVIVLWVYLERARKHGRNRPKWAFRMMAICLSILLASAMMESTAGILEIRRVPPEPPKPSKEVSPEPNKREVSKRSDSGTISIVVLGESSARGEPYQPWLSVGQILGWELERVFPGRKIELDMKARAGVRLKKMNEVFSEDVDHQPDAVIIYAGHNEFQARYGWERWICYYIDDSRNFFRQTFARVMSGLTPVSRVIRDEADRQWVDAEPSLVVTRGLVDRPICSVEERADVLVEFERHLDGMVTYAETLGALPILIIPAGNDSGFDPSRSVLSPSTEEPERRIFAAKFREAKALEPTNSDAAISAFRALIDSEPKFAESHFRLARLLESKQDYAAARSEYILARDLDGLPMRCPSDFQAIYRKVAARHDVVLVDAQEVLESVSPHGILDDHLFHDGQHPTLIGYVAIAQTVLDRLALRRAFGWPAASVPRAIDPTEIAKRGNMDPERWATVCDRSALFMKRLAYVRHDPRYRLDKMIRWKNAEQEVALGMQPEQVGVPGLGANPPGVRPVVRTQSKSIKDQR